MGRGGGGEEGGATEAKVDQTVEIKKKIIIRSIVRIILWGDGGCSTEEKVEQAMEMYFVESANENKEATGD